MSVTDLPPDSVPPSDDDGPGSVGPGPQERAWSAAEEVAISVMGTVNLEIARLVDAVAALLASDGWVGHGIRSPEHWLTYRAGVSRGRAAGLVRIARRSAELPECFALFRAGRLGEDAMVRIARRVPGSRDAEVAAVAPKLLIPQLERALASLPEQPDGSRAPRVPERGVQLRDGDDGFLYFRGCLPSDEGAVFRLGLGMSRDAEFRDRNPDTHSDGHDGHDGSCGCDGARGVTWADALVRMASEAADALDPTLARTGTRGERNLVVIHRDLDDNGRLGPGQLDLGATIPRSVAEYVSCDARIQVVTAKLGELLGIHPTERTVNRAMRRYLNRRDQGCTHPTCGQRLWLHAHHIVFWEHGGKTTAQNLVLWCPFHHRASHMGEFAIKGNPEDGTLRFVDRWGHQIVGPDTGGPPGPEPPGQPPGEPPPDGGRPRETGPPRRIFDPPLGERLSADDFAWN